MNHDGRPPGQQRRPPLPAVDSTALAGVNLNFETSSTRHTAQVLSYRPKLWRIPYLTTRATMEAYNRTFWLKRFMIGRGP